MRSRRSRSQRAGALSRCSTTGSTLTAATLPDGSHHPGPRPCTEPAGRSLGVAAVVEEAVDGRPGATDVRPKRAPVDELVDERVPTRRNR